MESKMSIRLITLAVLASSIRRARAGFVGMSGIPSMFITKTRVGCKPWPCGRGFTSGLLSKVFKSPVRLHGGGIFTTKKFMLGFLHCLDRGYKSGYIYYKNNVLPR